MAKRSDDEQDTAASSVLEYERKASRPKVFDPDSISFKLSLVVVAIGATWGIAIAFTNFTGRLAQNEKQMVQQRKTSLQIREFRDSINEFQLRNSGKIDVPKPYIERDEDGYPR